MSQVKENNLLTCEEFVKVRQSIASKASVGQEFANMVARKNQKFSGRLINSKLIQASKRAILMQNLSQLCASICAPSIISYRHISENFIIDTDDKEV